MKFRLEVRYVCSEASALSRVGRSIEFFVNNMNLYRRKPGLVESGEVSLCGQVKRSVTAALS